MSDFIENYLKRNNVNPIGKSYTDGEVNNNDIKQEILSRAASDVERNFGQTETGIGYDLSPLGDSEKYTDLGLSQGVDLLREQQRDNLDDILADTQSNWSKLKNALLQTAVSEVGIGTIKAFSDIFDAAINTFNDGVNDYTNPLSQTLEEAQEKFDNEIAPVYLQKGVDISNGGLLNVGWYMKNLPSIASSITLMIPGRAIAGGAAKIFNAANRVSGLGNNTLTRRLARAATKAVGTKKTADGVRLNALGEALNDTRNIKLVNDITKDLSTAAMMRVAENYQESRQTYKEMYEIAKAKLDNMSEAEFTTWYNAHKDEIDEEDVANNNRDLIAQKIANKSADRTFSLDMWNMIFDVAQLWGLRDATKIFKNVTSTKVLADHRKSIQQLGKSAEEIAALSKEASKFTRFGNTLKDVVRGTGKATIAESTEGIEEMVNYVASQEGITYGKLLLDDVKPTTFASRMGDYWHSPELWESAFWGLMGGVVFQGLGSAWNQRQVKKMQREAAEKRKKDGHSTEEVKASAWYELEEMPEIKAARAAVNGRNARTTDMFAKIARINAGYNIFAKEDEVTKETPQFEGTEEEKNVQKAKAKESVIDQYLADIVADAMHSGTYDTLMEYFGSEQMKKAMVQQGVVADEAAAANYVEKLKSKADHINSLYNEQIRHFSSQANFINYTNGNDLGKVIPMEYVQMVAKKNLDNILVRENLSDQEAIIDARISELMSSSVLDGVIDQTTPYTDIAVLGSISAQYTRLEATKKQVNKDDSISDLDKFIRTEQINRQQKALLEQLEKITTIGGKTSPSIGRVLRTLREAQSAEFDATGKLTYGLPEVIKTDKEILEEAGYKLSDVEVANAQLLSDKYDEHLTVFDKLIDAANAEVKEGEDAIKQLKEQSSELWSLFNQKADIRLTKALNESDIVVSQNDFIREVNAIHNQLNEVRDKALQKASDTLIEIYDKYKKEGKGDNIETVAALFLDGKKLQAQNYLNNNFTEDEAAKLTDVFDIFNLQSDNNLQIARYLEQLIGGKVLIDAAIARAGKADGEIDVDEEIEEETSAEEPTSVTPETTVTEEPTIPETKPKSEPKPKKSRKKNRGYKRKKRKEEKAAILEEERKLKEADELTEEEKAEQLSSTGELAATEASIESAESIETSPVEENVEEQTTVEPAVEEEVEPVVEPLPLTELEESLDVAISQALPKLTDAIKADINFNIDATIESMRTSALDANRENLTDEQYDALNKLLTDKLNNLADRLKRIQTILNKKNATLNESAEAVALASKIDIIGEETLPNVFVEGFEHFVDKYLQMSFCPIKDGKKVITIKEILDICERSISDTDGSVKGYILDKLKTYLKEDKVKEKYYIIDEDTLNKDLQAVNADKSKQNVETQQNRMRINIADHIDFHSNAEVSNSEKSKKYFEALDNLRTRDKLYFHIGKDGKFTVSKDGIVIGTGSFPKVVGDYYLQGNKGWLEDVRVDQGGDIVSDILTEYKQIFTSDDSMYQEIRSIIIEAIHDGNISQELIDKFINTEYIQGSIEFNPDILVADGKKIKENAKAMIEHLISLYNFSNQNATYSTKEEHISAINIGLNSYFNNLYTTYDTLSRINKDTEVEVLYINDGQLVKAFDDPVGHHAELPFATEAIADRANTRLSIHIAGESVIHVSGREAQVNRGLPSTQSVLTIFDRNGEVNYATIDYLNKNDLPYSQGFRDIIGFSQSADRLGERGIVKLLTDTLTRLVEKNNASNASIYDKVEELLKSIVSTGSNDRICLLRGLPNASCKITREENSYGYDGINLFFGTGGGTNINFTRAKSGKIMAKVGNTRLQELTKDNVSDFVEKAVKLLLDNTVTEVSLKGIQSDNNPTTDITKGILQRRNGKLINTLDGKEYDSYNDFIIDNNLVRVNLAKNERGRNFESRGTQQNRNQVLYVGVNQEVSSPVEEDTNSYTPSANTASNINQETRSKVLKAFDNGIASGKDLFIAAFGEEAYNDFINVASSYNILDLILPRSIKYHPRFNYTTSKGHSVSTNAATNTNNKDAFVKVKKENATVEDEENGRHRTNVRLKPGQTIIGDKLVDMFTGNGFARRRALTVIIHERLHDIIANNKEYTKEQILKAIRPIYEEFEAGCKKILESESKDSTLYKQVENFIKALKQYDNRSIYKDDSTKLEEFLVETITNSDVMAIMNSIDANTEGEVKSENIFTKLINFIAKYLFGTDIKKDKLLEKEIRTLSNLINDKTNAQQESKVKEEIVETVNKETGKTTNLIVTLDLPASNTESSTENNNNVNDDYANFSNIDILENFENSRLDGYLSALPVEQQLKFDAMLDRGTLEYRCSIN